MFFTAIPLMRTAAFITLGILATIFEKLFGFDKKRAVPIVVGTSLEFMIKCVYFPQWRKSFSRNAFVGWRDIFSKNPRERVVLWFPRLRFPGRKVLMSLFAFYIQIKAVILRFIYGKKVIGRTTATMNKLSKKYES